MKLEFNKSKSEGVDSHQKPMNKKKVSLKKVSKKQHNEYRIAVYEYLIP